MPKRSNTARKSTSHRTANASVSARNLRKADLGGLIFGCKNYTFNQCLSKQLFGLPASHYSYVRNVSSGMPLFLFNYHTRMLHGIYEATSEGNMNIDTKAWTCGDLKNTPFPAQVRMRVLMECQPLKEKDFKPLIAYNYYEELLFWFELDKAQTQKLLAMFRRNSLAPQKRLPVTQRRGSCSDASSLGGLPSGEDRSSVVADANIVNKTPAYNQNPVSFTQGKSWSGLFKPAASSSSRTEDQKCPPTWEVLETVEEEENPSHVPKWNSASSLAPPPIGKESLYEEDSVQSQGDPDKNWDSSPASSPTRQESHSKEAFVQSQDDPEVQPKSSPAPATSEQSSCSSEDDSEHSQVVISTPEKTSLPHECHRTCSPDLSSLTEEIVMDMASSDVRSVAVKLVQALRQMKVSQSRQRQEVDVLRQELTVQEQSESQNERSCAAASSLVFESNHSILMVGGHNGFLHLPYLECYSPFYDSVKGIQTMGAGLSNAAAVRVNEKVYILGGINGANWFNTVKSYNLANNSWEIGPSLSREKGSLAGIGLGNKIFAIGGADGKICHPEIEMLDLNAVNWIQTGSLVQKRFSLAAAELGGMIYITGGFDGLDYLESVEGFDPRQRSNIRLQSMNSKRACHSLAVLNEKLYAIGGYDQTSMISSVEVYDPRLNSWRMVEQMNHRRGLFGSVTIGRSIYAIGGLSDNEQAISTVERYYEGVGWQITSADKVGKKHSFATVLL